MPRGKYPRKPRLHTQVPTTPEDAALTSSVSGGGARLKVHLWPDFRGPDEGDGGVRRVVEGQKKSLAKYGIDLVSDAADADVIACHISIPPAYLRLHQTKPIVAHCHGLYWDDYEWMNWTLSANAKVLELLKVADAITAPSEWVANSIRRNTSRPVDVVHHGVDVDEWPVGESKGYVLWNKTRPDPVCDPQLMNDVAKLLPEVEFVSTFGDDAPNVTLTGKLPFEAAKALIQKAGIYLCTSKETFGIGTLEAMASGVPVVGYAWGGQTEIVREAMDGFLVRPNDAFNLSQAIKGALHDREPMSINARERAAEFTWDKAAEKYAAIYRRVYEERKAKRPRTSILVTNYNLHKYLDECLASVHEQTDEDWECIVVDDASTSPAGRAIALNWASSDPRFKLIENKTNVYLAEARNIGIRQARGKYILPLDADDMLDKNTVKLLADELDADRTIHVAYGNVYFVDEDGKTPTVYPGAEQNPGYSGWPMQFAHNDQVRQRNLLPYASMYRRTAWEYTGGYRPRCRTAEDADFWTRLSSYGFTPKMVTQEPTLIYRNRPGSMSREQGAVDWVKWFPWAREAKITPAGALSGDKIEVPSYDNIVVSVIIPVGPKHRTLVKDAIDSVDAQFFRNWECIVINDTIDPLPELPTWVRVLRNPGAGGVAQARNYGIENSKAPLFLPLDADDYLQPNALQWMVEAHMKTRDIIYPDFWEDPDEPGKFKPYMLKDYDAANLTHGTIHCVTALTPKSAWQRVGGYDESLPAWEDWDFQLKCADAGICSRRIAAPLWVYRKWTGQRRNDNVRDFETSKNGILSKWSQLWEGRHQLMACSSCAARASIKPSVPAMLTPDQQAARLASSSGGAGEDAVLVQYIGERRGNMPFKGKSGTFYMFSAGSQPKFVLRRDAAIFEGRPDFRVTERPTETAVEVAKAPVLVAEGNPNDNS